MLSAVDKPCLKAKMPVLVLESTCWRARVATLHRPQTPRAGPILRGPIVDGGVHGWQNTSNGVLNPSRLRG